MIEYIKDIGKTDNGLFTYRNQEPVFWAVYDKTNKPLGVVAWSELHSKKTNPIAHFKVTIAHIFQKTEV